MEGESRTQSCGTDTQWVSRPGQMGVRAAPTQGPCFPQLLRDGRLMPGVDNFPGAHCPVCSRSGDAHGFDAWHGSRLSSCVYVIEDRAFCSGCILLKGHDGVTAACLLDAHHRALELCNSLPSISLTVSRCNPTQAKVAPNTTQTHQSSILSCLEPGCPNRRVDRVSRPMRPLSRTEEARHMWQDRASYLMDRGQTCKLPFRVSSDTMYAIWGMIACAWHGIGQHYYVSCRSDFQNL